MLIKIEAQLSGERLDKAIHSFMPDLSRNHCQKLLKAGGITLNNAVCKDCSRRVTLDDMISIECDTGDRLGLGVSEETQHIEPDAFININILYEDDYISVINKQSGLTVHPGAGISSGTLVNALVQKYGSKLSHFHTSRPGIVHRLDRWTSGLMIAARDDSVHYSLSQMLKDRKIKRRYLAVVYGEVKTKSGFIEAPIGRSKHNRTKMAVVSSGKYAKTHYKVLAGNKRFTLLELELDTGRTHQIRVHMKHLGHPIVGDDVYCARKVNLGKSCHEGLKRSVEAMSRQALHAYSLDFIHPVTKEEHSYKAEPEKDMESVIAELYKDIRDANYAKKSG